MGSPPRPDKGPSLGAGQGAVGKRPGGQGGRAASEPDGWMDGGPGSRSNDTFLFLIPLRALVLVLDHGSGSLRRRSLHHLAGRRSLAGTTRPLRGYGRRAWALAGLIWAAVGWLSRVVFTSIWDLEVKDIWRAILTYFEMF